MKNLVTVIIPTYNMSPVLKLTLKSVLLQDFADFEVWVVGDGCSDDSESVVASLGDDRLKWVNLPGNTGSPNVPRNEGLKRARGRLIAYLGHDDLWFPWHLSKSVECIKKNNSDFVYTLGAYIGPDGTDHVFGLPKKSRNPQWTVSPSNWLHRRELLDRCGVWPPSRIWAADMVILERIWKADARISPVNNLSVLKFMSTVWRSYSKKAEVPQERYLDALIRNPESLRLDILHDISARLSRDKRSRIKNNRGSIGLFKTVIRSVFNIYGLHRWPVNQLMRWNWHRKSGKGKR